MACTITSSEFKARFDRGQFTYGIAAPEIRDADIDRAIVEALAVFNGDLYPDEAACQEALYYLTAHFLYLDTSASDDGPSPSFNQTSRSVGGVSESVSIPDWMMQGEFAFLSTTYYGQKYLILSKPYLDGAVFSVPGATQP